MRKLLVFLVSMFVMLLLFISAEARTIWFPLPDTATKQTAESDAFRLPASLREIGASAFEGTAVVRVTLPDSVTYLGDRAFADADRLHWIYIPDSVRSIGRDVFGANHSVIIAGTGDGATRKWAGETGYLFTHVTAVVLTAQTHAETPVHPEPTEETVMTAAHLTVRQDPAVGYVQKSLLLLSGKGRASLSIRSRYFP